MQNGVFYGEYTLKYWLDMMLDRRIVLPEYQRYFVWNASQVKGLIETFRDGRFVPPVTIGSYGCQGERQNLIIDGQQRLTSILLARLGKVPNRTWRSTDGGLAGGNEEGVTGLSDDDEDSIDVKRWKYAQLLGDSDNTIEGLSRRCENGRYIDITPVDDTFLETHFLGFCYVVPAKDSKEEQQAYYAKMFRSVNVGGIPLSQMESRRSLYFLKQDYENIFDPGFAKHITLKGQSKTVSPAQLDFVRYISLLAEYNNAQSADKIARGYKMRIESYYEEFICAIINHEESEKFGLSCNVFRVKKIKDILLKVEHVIKTNHVEREYASIIDMDLYFFGLFYWMIFEGRQIIFLGRLINQINSKLVKLKENDSHKRAPAALKYLRERLKTSVDIYKNFLLP